MSFDLSHFKKISEDAHSATLKHPKGHEIKVSKSSLTPKLRNQLSELPHFEEGGDVEEPSAQDSATPTVSNGQDRAPASESNPQDSSSGQGFFGSFSKLFHTPLSTELTPQLGPVDRSAASDVEAPPVQQPEVQKPLPQNMAPPAQPVNAPSQPNQTLQQLNQGFGMQEKGIQQQAQAQSQEGLREVQAADKQAQALEQIHKNYNDQLVAKNKDIDDTVKDIQNGHIDPNHYMNSKSSFGKVSTVIGLILGGIGQGLIGGENPALKFLNDSIDRDVKAQAADLGKKENILGAYFKQTGNIQEAMAMAKATQIGIYEAEVRKSMAQSKSPMALAAGNQLLGQLQVQKAQTLQPLAAKDAVLQGMQSGHVDPGAAISVIVPKERQEQAFKELQMAQNHAKQTQVILSSFDQANKQNTVGGRVAHAGFSPASVAQYQTAMMPYLKDAEGRINEQELQRTDALIPSPGDSSEKVAQKRQGLINFLQEKAAFPLLKAYGIKVPELPMPNSVVSSYKR